MRIDGRSMALDSPTHTANLALQRCMRQSRALHTLSSSSSPRCSGPGSRPAAAGRRSRAVAQPAAVNGAQATSIYNVLPSELLWSDNEHERLDGQQVSSADDLTVYSVRFATGYSRGAALSEPYSGINILLVGKDSRALLQRVSPLNDPASSIDQVNTICQLVDESVGANCSGVAPSSPPPPETSSSAAAPTPAPRPTTQALPPPPSSPSSQPSPPKLRFQEGQVDELCFLGPDLGPLIGVLVGTEAGSWLLDEVVVSSSRTAHSDRFVCREKLGVRLGEGAAWLLPVPPNASVYGSGDSTVILTKDQASSLRTQYLTEYQDLKARMLLTNALLAAGGTGVAALAAGPDAALPFALGGAAGLAYQWLLQLGVDGALDKGQQQGAGEQERSAAAAPRLTDVLGGVASSPAVRLGFVAAVSLLGVSTLQSQGLLQQVPSCEGVQCMVGQSTSEGALKLFFGLLGFLTYKVALVGTSLSNTSDEAAGAADGPKSKQVEAPAGSSKEDLR